MSPATIEIIGADRGCTVRNPVRVSTPGVTATQTMAARNPWEVQMPDASERFKPLTSILVACALTGGGPVVAQTWSTPRVVTSVPYLTGGAIATNGNTSAIVFAAGVATYNQFEVQAVVGSGGSWGPRVALAPQFQFAENFTVAVAPNGDALAAWRYDATMAADSGVAQVAFYTGGHWKAATTISTAGLNAGLPSVAFDGQNQATVVWEQNSSATTCAVMAARGDAAHGLGAPQTISNACYGYVDLAVNSSGQAVAVSGASGIRTGPIVAIARDANGTWAAPVTLAASVYRQRQPQVGLGNNGTSVVVWLTRGGVSYAARANGAWSAAAPLPGVPAGRAGGVAGVAVDGNGNAVATFTLTSLTPGIFATYRPVNGSWQAPVQIPAGPVPLKASPAGTFVAGSGSTVVTRMAGSSTWNASSFGAASIVDVAAGPGLAIVTLAGVAPDSLAVSTAAVP
jgi:hypothetical protein